MGWWMWVGCRATTGSDVVDPLPDDALQAIVEQLVVDAGSPGALLGVQRGDERWFGAAGTEDLEGAVPMPVDGRFRVGSNTKLFTGTLVLQEVDAGTLDLQDRLDRFVPTFPNAPDITVDQLLSHTAGVTAEWFDQPDLQAAMIADLSRDWAIDEVVERMATSDPIGPPGTVGMVYSNTDFVLLGAVLEAVTGTGYADLLEERLLAPLSLDDTTYGFDNPADLVAGQYEFGGSVLDITEIPQNALLSFAGPAGAVTSTTADLLTFADRLLRRSEVLDDTSVLTTPAETGSWYGHATMRFCPCADDFSGWGHGGNLPGYWSIVVYYPEEDVIVSAMVNRDLIDGVPLEVSVFDPLLAAVLDQVTER